MLNMQGIGFSYGGDTGVIQDLNLNVQQGELVAIVGPSGCGKSTILRLVAGLLKPTSGEVSWDQSGGPQIGFVFQDAALMPWKTVLENVALPVKLSRQRPDMCHLMAYLEQVGLGGFEERYPGTLSGGQKMRVSIARALSANPDFLLLDEPFGALDEILRFKLNDLLLHLKTSQGWSGLFVTHSLYEAAYMADRVLVMQNGTVVGMVLPELDRSLRPSEQRISKEFLAAIAQIGAFLEAEGGHDA